MDYVKSNLDSRDKFIVIDDGSEDDTYNICEKIFFYPLTILQKERTLAPSSKEQTNDADE